MTADQLRGNTQARACVSRGRPLPFSAGEGAAQGVQDMAGTSYIPAEDAAALTWMQQFALAIQTNPPLYMMTVADAVTITAAVNAFASALAVSDNENTRTKITITNKDDARVVAEDLCRQFAMLIKNNAGITDGDKIAAGVRPVNASREPVNVPDTSPIVSIIAATPGAQTLRFADSFTPNSPAKPFGAANLQLFCVIAEEASADENAGQFLGAYTKNPIAVAFDPQDDGKVATYFARWASRKGETGPWSEPISMRIAA
jgi:hypothetical protein